MFIGHRTRAIVLCTQNSFDICPILALLDLHQPFVVETDASNKGIGAVLQQDNHRIAFVSKASGPRNQTLSTYEKRMLSYPPRC